MALHAVMLVFWGALLGGGGGNVAALHLHHVQALGVQLQRSEFAAPHGPSVDGMDAIADMQAEGTPVSADDLQVARGMARPAFGRALTALQAGQTGKPPADCPN